MSLWPGRTRSLSTTCRSRFDDNNRLLDFLPLELPHSGINIEAIEKELILRALRKFDWNQTHAAQFLDLSRKTLIYRMEKFGLRREPKAGDQPGAAPQR